MAAPLAMSSEWQPDGENQSETPGKKTTMALSTSFAFSFETFQSTVASIFGPKPTVQEIRSHESIPFAHEACVFFPEEDSLFITSNLFKDSKTGQHNIQISKVHLTPERDKRSEVEVVQTNNVPMANGGVNYADRVLFCAQGNQTRDGGLALMDTKPPYKSEFLLQSFYGRPFNSVNDVVVHSDGSIWFTDPIYGYEQKFRPEPRLPPQVYRYDPATNSTRAMADGFERPNGISFNPHESVLYVTDTDWIHGDGTTDDTRVSNIYAFNITKYGGEPALINRRLFAMADKGAPDGIKCDVAGNVYAGCGDGINIWSPGGVLLGKIKVENGAANFCFGKPGEMFILNEKRLLRATLHPQTMGAFLSVKKDVKLDKSSCSM